MIKLLFIAILTLIASILPQDLVVVFAPLFVWLATTVANWVKAKLGSSSFGGFAVISVLVPGLSLLAAWLTQYLLKPDLTFWTIFGLSLVGTFINEFIKQFAQTVKKVQTYASTKFFGLK